MIGFRRLFLLFNNITHNADEEAISYLVPAEIPIYSEGQHTSFIGPFRSIYLVIY